MADSDQIPSLFSPFAVRLWILLLCLAAFTLCVSMKQSLGMAMVCMVNNSAFADSSHSNDTGDSNGFCPNSERSIGEEVRYDYQGTLLWSPSMQSILFSALAYGSLLTTVPAGLVVDRMNQKIILACTVGIYSIMTLLAPCCAELGYVPFLVNSFVFSGMTALGSRWFPPAERSTTVGIYTSGSSIAGMLNGALAPLFCKQRLLGGWPLIYYFYGALGLVWMLLWQIVCSQKPENNRWISRAEKEYLMKDQLTKTGPKRRIPWHAAIGSKPLWAIVFSWFSFGSFVAIHHSILPSYFRDVLQLPLTTNGIFMMCVFAAQLVSKILCGMVSDFIRSRGLLNETGSCRFFQAVSSFGSAIPLLVVALFIDCRNPYLGLVIILIHCELTQQLMTFRDNTSSL
uniref:MFS domain-containing protein n=1 Tax=Steinernema glaseri TaxID=37863 RepID=A0A1I8AD76_9BILA